MTASGRHTAFLDANVLYSAAVRDIFMEVALAKVYQAKWSADVHSEWLAALSRNRPDLDRAKLERTRELMDRAIPGALVTGYRHLIPGISPEIDSDDRHVVAAAIAGECELIVTSNVAHFPQQALDEHGLVAQRPDDFLVEQMLRSQDAFLVAVRSARAAKKNPPFSVDAYLAHLSRHGLVATVAALRQHANRLA